MAVPFLFQMKSIALSDKWVYSDTSQEDTVDRRAGIMLAPINSIFHLKGGINGKPLCTYFRREDNNVSH